MSSSARSALLKPRRYPASLADFEFVDEEVFCGLCPHDEIGEFEESYSPIRFIDPRREMKWYATALIECRQRLDLKHSVVRTGFL